MNYRGQCIGRLIHFLEEYFGYRAHEVIFQKNNEISYYGKLLAKYEWKNGDIPHFTFYGENASYCEDKQFKLKEDIIKRDNPIVGEYEKILWAEVVPLWKWAVFEVDKYTGEKYEIFLLSGDEKVKNIGEKQKDIETYLNKKYDHEINWQQRKRENNES